MSDFELQELFREASFSLPGYKVREIMETFIAGDTNKDEKISFEEFVSVSSVTDHEQIYECVIVSFLSHCLWHDHSVQSNTACSCSDLSRAEE